MSFSIDTSLLIWERRFAYPRANFPTSWQRFETLIRDREVRASGMVPGGTGADRRRVAGVGIGAGRPVRGAGPAAAGVHAGRAGRLLRPGSGRRRPDQRRPVCDRPRHPQRQHRHLAGTNVGEFDHAKIPNVCAARGVECMNFVQFIARQGWVF
ncbi:MAG: DUF4411 family protein [Acidobacteria bacterium]|nr:DUF4411 family protein [Acidobacteriota bacterium]